MRLSLRGWPPVASHVAFLLLGVSLAHLSWQAESPQPRLPPKAIILSLPPSLIRQLASAGRGARVYPVKMQAGAEPCRISTQPMQILTLGPVPAVSTAYGAAGDIAAIVGASRAGLLALLAANSGQTTPLCNFKPKVSYGSP